MPTIKKIDMPRTANTIKEIAMIRIIFLAGLRSILMFFRDLIWSAARLAKSIPSY
jgi:hypothetical protein